MAARWKHPNHKNHHEQMLIRCALVAYAGNHGADAAARKFNCSIPSVYYWIKYFSDCYDLKDGDNLKTMLEKKKKGDAKIRYIAIIELIAENRDYSTYVIFE